MSEATRSWHTRSFHPADKAVLESMMRATYDRGDLPGRQWYDVQTSLDQMPAAPEDTIVGMAEGRLVGYVTPYQQELVVDPRFRRQGLGTRLVEAGCAFVRANGGSSLVLAPPPGSAGPKSFAERLGFAYDSSLWQLVLQPNRTVEPPMFPTSVLAAPYSAAVDVAEYVGLINTVFIDHPSPIAVTVDIVGAAHARPTFVPDDILILSERADPGKLVGFCRVRIDAGDAGERIGEISLIGVLPEWRGLGLGRQLLRWGVQRLRAGAVDQLTLHVEARNAGALELYECTGFLRGQEWPRWSLPVSSRP